MRLDPDEFELFHRLHIGLMSYVANRKGFFSDGRRGYIRRSVEDRMEVHEAYNEDRAAMIDAYVAENPDGLGEAELEEVRTWKASVTGNFFVFRQLKNHMILLGAEEKPVAYGVVGLIDRISDIVVSSLPAFVSTTLIPFQGRIVFDGIMSMHRLAFGGGIKASLNEGYKAAKAGDRIVVSLVGDPDGKAKKRVAPKERLIRLTEAIRKKLLDLRKTKGEIKAFTENSLPLMDKWVEENLKEERARLEKLTVEVDDLEFALEEIEMAWEEGVFRTKREAAEVILAEIAEERREIERERKREASRAEEAGAGGAQEGENGDEGEEDEEGGWDDFEKDGFDGEMGGEIPDLMLDFLFEKFMEEMRGVDVHTMGKKEYREARARFKETMGHAEKGDRSAFEKGLLETGADTSQENVAAVKKIFRRLAKRLHPDQNPEFCETAKELWEELGAAKKALDLGAMVNLELHWQILQGDTFSTKDERRLKVFQEEVNGEISEVRMSRRELELHPMWGHQGDTPPPEVAEAARADMAEIIGELKARKKELKSELAQIRKRPRRFKHAKKKGGAKKKPTPAKKKALAKKKISAAKKPAVRTGARAKAKMRPPMAKKKKTKSSEASDPTPYRQGELDF